MAGKVLPGRPGIPRSSEPIDLEGDPLAAILGPGSGTTLLGKETDEIPEEVAAIFAEHGLTNRKYRVVLKQVPEGSTDDGNLPFIKSWTRSIPSIDYIGREYGPGTYKLTFMWTSSEGGKSSQRGESMMITVSDKFLAEYKEHQFNKKLNEMENRRTKVRDQKLEGTMDALIDPYMDQSKKSDETVEQAALKYVDNITSMAEKLGLTRKQGFDWDKVLPIAMSLIPALMNTLSESKRSQQAESQRMLTLMTTVMSQNNAQLIDVMKSQQNPRGADLTKEMFEMIKGAIDVKEMIADHGKETVADRVFGIIGQVAPHILEVAKLNAMQRQMDPRYQIAKMYAQQNPDVKEAMHSPTVAAELYAKLDANFGWRQADVILSEVGGITRPDNCPRRPEYEMPADQRGTTDSPTNEVDTDPSPMTGEDADE